MLAAPPRRVVVLASGSGTNLQALLDADLGGGEVVAVVTDRDGVGALERARAAGVATRTVRPGDHPDRAAWDAALLAEVSDERPDLVVLAGFMRILGPAFGATHPTLNVHPSLLPAFPGGHAVEEALRWGARVTGCTVHLVDELVDHGPILAQEAVPIAPDDTHATLHARIQAVEHRLLPTCVRAWCEGRVSVDGRRVVVDPPPRTPVSQEQEPR